jgi:hypothetical protein
VSKGFAISAAAAMFFAFVLFHSALRNSTPRTFIEALVTIFPYLFGYFSTSELGNQVMFFIGAFAQFLVVFEVIRSLLFKPKNTE